MIFDELGNIDFLVVYEVPMVIVTGHSNFKSLQTSSDLNGQFYDFHITQKSIKYV